MWRLTPPTKTTFGLSILAIAVGIVLHLGLADVEIFEDLEDLAFWITAAGGVLLTIGVLFRRI